MMKIITALLIVFSSSAFAQTPEQYTLTVTSQELNVIGDGLVELPYKKSAILIQKLTLQAKDQMEAAKKAADDKVKANQPEDK